MALIHRAELHPTKLDLLTAWLPGRPWYSGPDQPELQRVSAYRFDDPAGEVGVETLIVTAGDGVDYQVPLTYRAAPLDGAGPGLIGTTEHSVLGTRWVYDGCGDPVYAAALAATILGGGGSAPEYVDVDGDLIERAPAMAVRGGGPAGATTPQVTKVLRVDDGDPAVVVTDTVELSIFRIPGPDAATGPAGTALTGTWTAGGTPLVLARCAG